MSTAAVATRAVTAAAGLQPASISDDANVPDVPNVAADSTAILSPGHRAAHGPAPTGTDGPGEASRPRSGINQGV